MTLSKLPQTTFTPGTPEVPARPARTVCVPSEASGTWVWTCRRIDYVPGQSIAIPPGGELIVVYGDEIDPITGELIVVDTYIRVCGSEWVPSGRTPTAPVCTDYPATPYQPAVPARYESTPTFEWNAGANSITELDGDVVVTVTGQNAAVGIVVGLADDRELPQGQYERISHGFYFHTNTSGHLLYDIIESGSIRTGGGTYTSTTVFELLRVGGVVTYLVDGALRRTSSTSSSGVVFVGTSLYATGDTI